MTEILFIHGTFGSPSDWEATIAALPASLQARARSFTLAGHGPLASSQPGDSGVKQVQTLDVSNAYAALLRSVEDELDACGAPPVLVGYSLGGRLALDLALRAPERVRRLVLIGANPGISMASERVARARLDDERALELRRDGLRRFLRRWYQQPLFSDLAADTRRLEDLIASRKNLDPRAMAAVVGGASPGRVRDHWPLLHDLAVPSLYVAGGRDRKYVEIGRRFAQMAPHASLEIVEGAGHAVPLTHPAALADALIDVLEEESAR